MTFEWFELKVVMFAGLTVAAVLAVIVLVVLRNGHRGTRLVRRRVERPVRESRRPSTSWWRRTTPTAVRLHDS